MQEQPEATRHKHPHAAAYQIHETLEMETSRHRRQTNATNLASQFALKHATKLTQAKGGLAMLGVLETFGRLASPGLVRDKLRSFKSLGRRCANWLARAGKSAAEHQKKQVSKACLARSVL
jgi:hypothetical protein